jgi:hypothetical protein
MADPSPPKRSLIWRLWGVIMFVLVAGALASSAYLYGRLRREEAARATLATEVAAFGPRFEQFKSAVRDVGKQLSTTVFQEVDLGASGWQPIQGGFYVIDLSVVAAGKGTRISGKVVNPTSVVHENANFSVRIDEHRGTFALTRMPPGVGAAVRHRRSPDVRARRPAKKAFFALDSSTINFASSTTRKRAEGRPPRHRQLLK